MRRWESNQAIGEAVNSVGSMGQDEESPTTLAHAPAGRSEGKHPDPMPVGRNIPDKILDRLVRKRIGTSCGLVATSLASSRAFFVNSDRNYREHIDTLTFGPWHSPTDDLLREHWRENLRRSCSRAPWTSVVFVHSCRVPISAPALRLRINCPNPDDDRN